ncbi:hypothetical protein LTR91_017738 [Friedmanniomyces endolithicus]|uniref:Aminoglycoside phosphotransferase domain-containing protein n=1 Tax=Friedmanniomyces endolithicus TaxID=329885 RepID=A0AAN6QJ25_9PEZI|nr:hypothetical protein LTR57_019865 [Friedmanniomyces endolithicus]KAK0966003.1 hypothetical protein LTR91_017738 [Friedmanniomyces endolithicus]KAK0966408.1 hypothetical protein LTS01_017805 [Friedmanniomyces endolithicus]KAK1050514.1 hypothetical protein LTS16_003011 [Friedmanniomyces endolithicus]
MAGVVRQTIDQEALERYIKQNFGFGQSNPTYQITDSTRKRYVLRKKPPGKLLSKTAHQVDREYRVIHALEQTDVPVPRAYCLCEDESILGTAFYIMEFFDGRMFENPSFPGVPANDRREMWHDAIRTLAKLHRLNPSEIGLSTFGKPSGFYTRQLATFARLAQSQASARDADTSLPVGHPPHFHQLLSLFSRNQPRERDGPVLVHGDYKIDNLVFHPTQPRVIGILDWEMSTIGHPLADLTNVLGPWTVSNATTSWPRIHADAAFLSPSRSGSKAAEFPGLPSREEVVGWYEEAVGWRVPAGELEWATGFALFRDSVIFQGIAARWAVRQASSEKAMVYGREMGPFAEMAWALVGGGGVGEGRARL